MRTQKNESIKADEPEENNPVYEFKKKIRCCAAIYRGFLLLPQCLQRGCHIGNAISSRRSICQGNWSYAR